MAKFTIQTTVNYAASEATSDPTPDLLAQEVAEFVEHLLTFEGKMTSCLITIVKQKED